MIHKARTGKVFGIILGTLGHQGNLGILNRLKSLLQKRKKTVISFLMSELFPAKIKLIKGIDVRIISLLFVCC
jgi:2-(3-amino-3-carboxypropyl)histidine synthase